MSLQDRIKEDLKEAQLAKDAARVSTLRLLMSEIYNARIQKGDSFSDEDIVGVIRHEIKKRMEAQAAFRNGGREDSAQKEEVEERLLEQYLPPQLTNEELTKVIDEAINEVGATTMTDMGKVIGMVMSKVDNRADGGRVSVIVKEKLHG